MRSSVRPVVTIVVLSFNRPEYTEQAIDALGLLRGETACEVIVVDNGSDWQTRAMLRDYVRSGAVAKLLELPENRGTSRGYNAGFAQAHAASQFFTKLDNDILVLDEGWIGKILEVFRDAPEAAIVATDIVNHQVLATLPVLEVGGGHRVKSWDAWVAGGGGMTFPRALYERFGGFRERFSVDLKLMPDDYDFFCRARSFGSRHLAILRDAGIVSAERRGKEVYYSICAPSLVETLRSLADAIEACCPAPGKRREKKS